ESFVEDGGAQHKVRGILASEKKDGDPVSDEHCRMNFFASDRSFSPIDLVPPSARTLLLGHFITSLNGLLGSSSATIAFSLSFGFVVITFSLPFSLTTSSISSSVSSSSSLKFKSIGSKHIIGMICKYTCFSPLNVQLSTLNSAAKFPQDDSIDSAFARFNTIITSLKALDKGYSSKNYVWKFLGALHPKWREKVTAIEESKDLTSLSLDELTGNLKVHEMIIKKDSKIVKEKVERKSLALKAKKESSDEECSTFGSEDEYRDDKNRKSERKCFRCGDPNYLIRECPKPPRDKNQKAFIGGSWSDSDEENDEKIQDEICLLAQAPNEVCFESSYFSDENSSVDDLALDNEYDKLYKMSLQIITKNKKLKAIGNSLENELRELKDKLITLEKNKGVDIDCAKFDTLKIENEKLKEESTKLKNLKRVHIA
nr:zf-CCHC domain-containing protein/UBN2 domain-containing protein [Tanacetum cinerariifolium]